MSPGRSRLLASMFGLAGVLAFAVALLGVPGTSGQQGDVGGVGERRNPATAVLHGRPPAASGDTEVAATARRVRVTVVRGYEDEPIPDAEVRVVGADGVERTATTGADGVATLLGLPGGTLRITANAGGYAVSEEELLREEWGRDESMVVRLEPSAPVHGRVIDAEDGLPIADVKVTALEGGAVCFNPYPPQTLGRVFGSAFTGPDGHFVVEGVSREPLCSVRLLRVDAPGYRTLWKIAPPHGHDDDFVIRMLPGGSVEGVVRSARGDPVPGARVVCGILERYTYNPIHYERRIDLPRRYFSPVWASNSASIHVDEDAWVALTATADAAGRYRIDGLGLGERYVLAARAEGHAFSEPVPDVRATSTDTAARVDLGLREPCRLTVHCRDKSGEPWPGISVSVEPLDHAPDYAECDADERGVARFTDLPPQKFYVRVHEYRNGAGALVEFDGHPGDAALTLTVDHARPEPSPTPQADPAPQGADERERTSTPKPEPTLLARLAVPDGVEPPKSVGLWGYFKGGSGSGGGEWKPDATGTMPVEWFWDELRYTFVVRAEGFLPLRRKVDRAPGTACDLGLLTLDPGETLRGHVRLPDGSPLAGVDVEVTYPASDTEEHFDFGDEDGVPSRQWWRSVTAPDGSFVISGLPRDRMSLTMGDSRFLPFHTHVERLPLQSPLSLTVALGSILHIHVEDEDGFPAPRQEVRIYEGAGTETYVGGGETNAEGVFSARLGAGAFGIGIGARYADDPPEVPHLIELGDGVVRDVRLEAPRRR